jgi:hypothetical protein
MEEHEAKKREDIEKSRHRKKVQPIYDQLKQAAEFENDQMKQALAGLSMEEQAPLISSPQLQGAQRTEAMLGLQQTYGNRYVQRLAEGSEQATLDEGTITRIGAQKGSGKPLEAGTRAEMEAAFKQDFGDVRIQADDSADELARELGAKAFTTGKDVFFREGAYQPGSEAGKSLLGHELTHVVQQEGGIQARNAIGRIGDVFEEEAALAGQAMSEGQKVSVEKASAVPALQREAATTAEAKAPEAGAGVDKARLAALKVMFEAAVVGPMRKAYEVMGGDKPDAQAGQKYLQTSYEVLLSLLEPYKGVEPMFSRLVVLGNMMHVWGAQLRPHVGAAAIPLSQIRDDLNPDKNTVLKAIRSQF